MSADEARDCGLVDTVITGRNGFAGNGHVPPILPDDPAPRRA